jgi:hypothetical protein
MQFGRGAVCSKFGRGQRLNSVGVQETVALWPSLRKCARVAERKEDFREPPKIPTT